MMRENLMQDGEEDEEQEVHMIYSIGGALVMVCTTALRDLNRKRRVDNAVIVPHSCIKKSLLVKGKVVKLKREDGQVETQYRWHCPNYPDLVLGYQHVEWNDRQDKTSLYLYDDVVFETPKDVMEAVFDKIPKQKLPECYEKVDAEHVRISIKPIFSTEESNSSAGQFLHEGKTLGVVVTSCKEEDPEPDRNEAILKACGENILQTSPQFLTLDWDPVKKSMVIVVQSKDEVKLHLKIMKKLGNKLF